MKILEKQYLGWPATWSWSVWRCWGSGLQEPAGPPAPPSGPLRGCRAARAAAPSPWSCGPPCWPWYLWTCRTRSDYFLKRRLHFHPRLNSPVTIFTKTVQRCRAASRSDRWCSGADPPWSCSRRSEPSDTPLQDWSPVEEGRGQTGSMGGGGGSSTPTLMAAMVIMSELYSFSHISCTAFQNSPQRSGLFPYISRMSSPAEKTLGWFWITADHRKHRKYVSV